MDPQLRRKSSRLIIGKDGIVKLGRKKDAIEKFISQEQTIVKSALSQLRYLILVEGMPSDAPYRSYVWSILLRSSSDDATQNYLSLLKHGEPQSLNKIKNDTFRTLTTDASFKKKVSEDSLTRLLSAFAWTKEIPDGTNISPYVQGMNVLAAPFLYCSKSEPQAFALFATLVHTKIPLYLTRSLDGVHTGAKLVDICLKIIDPELYECLSGKLLHAEIYGIPLILTLSASTPPLSQVLKIWDFLFAYGVHMNILFIVAQLILMRQQIMESSAPVNLLRSFPEIDANELIKLGVGFVAKLPRFVYDLLVRHPYDESVRQELDALLE